MSALATLFEPPDDATPDELRARLRALADLIARAPVPIAVAHDAAERAAREVTSWRGRASAPEGVGAWNPAFDVTPAELITAIVTDRGIVAPRDVARAIE